MIRHALPTAAEIRTAQNLPGNLQRQAACRAAYRKAKRLTAFATVGSVGFALIAPVIAIHSSGAAEWFAALAGLWLFVGRLVLLPAAQTWQRTGAVIQEGFDWRVLGVASDASLAAPVPGEQIAALSRSADQELFRDWYSPDDGTVPPTPTLSCQRANAVWSQRLHRSWAFVIIGATASIVSVGVAASALSDLLLVAYLGLVLLPSLPLLLNSSESARSHLLMFRARNSISSAIESEISTGVTQGSSAERHQAALFGLRSSGPMVPDNWYKFSRMRFEEDMKQASKMA